MHSLTTHHGNISILLINIQYIPSLKPHYNEILIIYLAKEPMCHRVIRVPQGTSVFKRSFIYMIYAFFQEGEHNHTPEYYIISRQRIQQLMLQRVVRDPNVTQVEDCMT